MGNMKICSITSAMMWLVLCSFTGIAYEEEYKGIECGDDLNVDEYLVTWDLDTLRISDRISDSLLVVGQYRTDQYFNYLVKQKDRGTYHVVLKGQSISTISGTKDYVYVGNDGNHIVYNVNDSTSFSLPGETYWMVYLGRYEDKSVFCDDAGVYFSDGKCLALPNQVYCKASSKPGYAIVGMGARKKEVPFQDLYLYRHEPQSGSANTIRHTEKYLFKPAREDDFDEAGFSVDLDIPSGSSNSDNAIRQWMLQTIKKDIFSALDTTLAISDAKGESVAQMLSTLNRYHTLWNKIYYNGFTDNGANGLRQACSVKTRKVADCEDYTTYFYYSYIYCGGAHGMPSTYYITYDKKRREFLTAKNTIKKSMMNTFREEVLRSIKPQYEEYRKEVLDWDNYQENVFGWYGSDMDKDITINDFPLPYLAILPEGVVVSYQRYMIDCFAAGEFHAIVPFDKASPCLKHQYKAQKDETPTLEEFLE